MTVTCSACGYDKNPDGAEFCDACGSELVVLSGATTPPLADQTEPEIPIPTPNIPAPKESYPGSESPVPEPTYSTSATARLVPRQNQPPISEFVLDGSNGLIGIFDPDAGPVDIDLEDFQGSDTVSRQHAEIYQENGAWKIKDLGSTNGVFLKPVGQSRFGARITTPTILNTGDEIAIAKVRFLFKVA